MAHEWKLALCCEGPKYKYWCRHRVLSLIENNIYDDDSTHRNTIFNVLNTPTSYTSRYSTVTDSTKTAIRTTTPKKNEMISMYVCRCWILFVHRSPAYITVICAHTAVYALLQAYRPACCIHAWQWYISTSIGIRYWDDTDRRCANNKPEEKQTNNKTKNLTHVMVCSVSVKLYDSIKFSSYRCGILVHNCLWQTLW